MARIRTLKPEITESIDTASLENDEWRLFVSLITFADDHGAVVANPVKLEAAAFWAKPQARPLDEILCELVKRDLVSLYMVKGCRYIQITNWKRHQKIDRPSAPKYPRPDDPCASPVTLASVSRGCSEYLATSSDEPRETLGGGSSGDRKGSEGKGDLSRARDPGTAVSVVPSTAPAPVHENPKAAFSKLWVEVTKKSPTGNWSVLEAVTQRISASAEVRGTEPAVHGRALVVAFVALVDGWRKAKRPTPQVSVEAFEKHFAACEEVVNGERDPKETLVVEAQKNLTPPVKRPREWVNPYAGEVGELPTGEELERLRTLSGKGEDAA